MTSNPLPRDLELSDEERSAKTHELFELWRELQPNGIGCFCGDDAELVRALGEARERVRQHRERQQREAQRQHRGHDGDEIGS